MEQAVGTASLLIRTLDEGRHLESTLKAVFSQSRPPAEVFVIDSGSRDATLDIARSFPTEVVQIDPAHWSYPRALNLGASVATSEFLVCLSAHCLPLGPEWLTHLLAPFEDPRVAAVWGPELNPSRLEVDRPERQVLSAGSYDVANRTWGMSNANSALRRSLWQEIPFDESLPGAEDKAWARTVMDLGWHIVYEPAAVVRHERHTPRRAYQRNRAVTEGYAAMFPGLDRPAAGMGRKVARDVRRTLAQRLRHPNVRQILTDTRQVGTSLAHLLGGIRANRRR